MWNTCIAAVVASWKMCRVCDIMMLTKSVLRRGTGWTQGAKIPDLVLQSAPLCLCILLEGKKKAELPDDYFVLTLGLSAPLESDRVAAKTEPYPGRWTTHFVISSPSDLDEELFDWIEQAYQFAQAK